MDGSTSLPLLHPASRSAEVRPPCAHPQLWACPSRNRPRPSRSWSLICSAIASRPRGIAGLIAGKGRRVYSRWGWQLRYLVATVRPRPAAAAPPREQTRPSMKPARRSGSSGNRRSLGGRPGLAGRDRHHRTNSPAGRQEEAAQERPATSCVGNPEQFIDRPLTRLVHKDAPFDSFLFSQQIR